MRDPGHSFKNEREEDRQTDNAEKSEVDAGNWQPRALKGAVKKAGCTVPDIKKYKKNEIY